MIDAISSAINVTTLSASTRMTVCRGRSAIDRASAGTHGVDPIAPAMSASHNSGVKYHCTVYGVGAADVSPAIAFTNPSASAIVAARKKTQPIITTSIVYTCGQMGQERMPGLEA